MHVIDTEQTFESSFKEICSFVRPTIIHVRSGATPESKLCRQTICENLEAQGFFRLDVEELKVSEKTRGTEIGRGLRAAKRGRHDLVVQMIQKIIYNGQDACDKYLLVGFPDGPDQAAYFE